MSSPAEFAASLREQKTLQKRRRLFVGVGGAVLLLLVGVLVWLLLFSSVLDARSVKVEGLKLLEEQTVVDTAAVPIGTPLARIRTGEVADRVGALSEVRNAFVTREFPNTIKLRVVEREPLFQTSTGGTFTYIDSDAVVVRDGQPRHDQLPVARIPKPDERKLLDVGVVVAALPDAVTSQTDSIELRSVDRIEVNLKDGRKVVWGSAEESDLKAQVIEPLLQVEAKIYDVTAPNHPTTR